MLDGRIKRLTATGIGMMKKQAQPLTPAQEDLLWEKRIFMTDTADGLLNALFWYSCKCFGLHGGNERRQLEVDQYSLENGRYLCFVGKSAKNYQAGLQHRKLHNKDLCTYSMPESGACG